MPLLAYLLELVAPGAVAAPFAWSTLLAGLAFFAVGALKGRFVRRSAVLSGLETLLVGGLAAIAAYGIGWSLERVAGTG